MSRRKFTDTYRKKVLAYYRANGRKAAMSRYKISSSVLHNWVKAFPATAQPPAPKDQFYAVVTKDCGKAKTMDALVYLRQARVYGIAGEFEIVWHLSALALLALEGKLP